MNTDRESTKSIDKRFCECGCGREVRKARYPSQQPRFINGHGTTGKRINWGGGEYISTKGYVYVYNPKHPRASNHYVFKHILVMEKHIGRYITKDEDVHHINGNKQDNKIKNLQLITHRQHAVISHLGKKYKGQRDPKTGRFTYGVYKLAKAELDSNIRIRRMGQ